MCPPRICPRYNRTPRLSFPSQTPTVRAMSTESQAVLGQIKALPIRDQRELWQELGRQIGKAAPPDELYGEPLTDQDIEESARVTFQMLDEEEKRAGAR